MANITGRQTINHVHIISVDGDPSAGGGTASPIGSVATVDTGSGLWIKSGAGATAWTVVGGGGSMAIGGSITSATAGSVLFAGAAGVLAQDNSNFFWDDTNNRLGLGTTGPTYGLHVNNAATANTGTMFVNAAANSTGTGLVINTNTRTNADNAVAALQVISRTNESALFTSVEGNVGIGTGSPANRLHVQGLAGITDVFRVDNSSGTTLFSINNQGTGGNPTLRLLNGSGKVGLFDARGADPAGSSSGFVATSASAEARAELSVVQQGVSPQTHLRMTAWPTSASSLWGVNIGYSTQVLHTTSTNGGSMYIGSDVNSNVLFGRGSTAASSLYMSLLSSEIAVNDSAADHDFRIEGSGTRPSLLHVDAGLARVGINRTAGNHGATLDIDNLAVAESIFIARDNGTAVLTIADGGDTTIAPVSGHTNHALTITGGTLVTGKNSIYVTGTLADSANSELGSLIDLTLSGTGANDKNGLGIVLSGAGYTGAGGTTAVAAFNGSAGTANTPFSGGGKNSNMAYWGQTAGTTATGANIGALLTAQGSSVLNAGFFGISIHNISTTNTGVIGVAGGASATRVGVFASLAHSSNTAPTWTTAALLADNRDQAQPIAIFRDNGTTVLTVADGGDVTIAPVAGHAGDTLTVTGGTLASTKTALNITATQSTTDVQQNGINIVITSAGSGTTVRQALFHQLAAGYTGSGGTRAAFFHNTAAGTAAGMLGSGDGNTGVWGNTDVVTAGHNVGLKGRAVNSSVMNIGVLGIGHNGGSGWSIGTAGRSTTGSGLGNNLVGGLFTVEDSANFTAPTLAATALLVDNMNFAVPVAIFRDNGSAVLTIADGGGLTQEGGAVFNEVGGNFDFRVEGDTLTHMVFVDASADAVGFGTSTPDASAVISQKKHTAFTGSESNSTTAAVQTTDATVTTLFSKTLSDNTLYWFEATIIGRDTGGTDRALYRKQGLFYRQAAGSATQEGSTASVITDIETAAGWDATFDVSTNDVRVRVTGAAATTINWAATVTWQAVSGNT